MTLRRSIIIASIALGLGMLYNPALAQEATVRRGTTDGAKIANGATSKSSISRRALEQNRQLTQDINHVDWKRTVYRQLDLNHERNAALYYPTQPSEAAQNLFVRLFRLVASGELTAYEYLDGVEIFDKAHQVEFKDILERFRISYTPGKGKGNERYQVALADIPSLEVKAYYLKETWYFNQATSSYDTKIDAICPILYDLGDYGEVPMPLFWLPYESVRPYLATQPVMLSSYNNVASATLDDFFRLKMYEGEIVKTQNLLNRSLAQSVSNPDSLGQERKRIEQQLTDFGDKLFIPDSLLHKPREAKASTKSEEKSNSRDKRVRSVKTTTKANTAKATASKQPKAPKAPKPAKASTSGRSVRGRH